VNRQSINQSINRNTYSNTVIQRKRRSRVTLSFHVYPSDMVQLKSGQTIGFLDGLDDLRKVDAWDQSFLIKTAISEYIANHHPGNPGLPLTHWTKAEPLSEAAQEKLAPKPTLEAEMPHFEKMTVTEIQDWLRNTRFIDATTRSFANWFIRKKQAEASK